jgi:hypothetical protein
MTRYCTLSKTALLILFMGLLFPMSASIAHAQVESDVEQTRIFGKMFVQPIEVGAFPPVCVVEPICGPSAKSDFKSMRDIERPALMIFCRDDIKPEWKKILVEVDRFATEHKLPVFLIVTMQKGVAGKKSEDFDSKYYLKSEQLADQVAKWKAVIEEMGVKQITAGAAVNRFWRDSLGYGDDAEVLVSYVRGKVLSIQPFVPASTTETEIQSMIYNFSKLHLQSK